MRIMLAGTGSGCGKTTLALALMASLRAKGLAVAPFKAGPDYIDPGFHRLACGHASHNLDEWLCVPGSVRRVLARGGAGADIADLHGVGEQADALGGEEFFDQRRLLRVGIDRLGRVELGEADLAHDPVVRRGTVLRRRLDGGAIGGAEAREQRLGGKSADSDTAKSDDGRDFHFFFPNFTEATPPALFFGILPFPALTRAA